MSRAAWDNLCDVCFCSWLAVSNCHPPPPLGLPLLASERRLLHVPFLSIWKACRWALTAFSSEFERVSLEFLSFLASIGASTCGSTLASGPRRTWAHFTLCNFSLNEEITSPPPPCTANMGSLVLVRRDGGSKPLKWGKRLSNEKVKNSILVVNGPGGTTNTTRTGFLRSWL